MTADGRRGLLARLRRLAVDEVGSLVLIILIAGGVLAFIHVMGEVREGETARIDEMLLRLFRNPADPADPIGPAWLEVAVRDVTGLGGTAVLTLLTAAVVLYLLLSGRRGAAVLVTVAVIGGTVLSESIKGLFARPRPDLVAHLVYAEGGSFPSGHAMLSAVTYLTLGVMMARLERRRRLKTYVIGIAITITVMVGVSRVYLGVHWPSDVLAGWCIGAAWALLCWLVTLWLQRRGAVEPPQANGPAAPD